MEKTIQQELEIKNTADAMRLAFPLLNKFDSNNEICEFIEQWKKQNPISKSITVDNIRYIVQNARKFDGKEYLFTEDEIVELLTTDATD